jgi:Binding-protein-dependent transport system inner membrane component
MTVLPEVSTRRRVTDRGMRALTLLLTLVALVPLVLIIYYLLAKGLKAWNADFFTTDPSGRFLGDPGGIKSAIWGTILMVALASVIAIPIGIGVAIYLVEYGKRGRFANIVRYFVDVMTGVPSVVFGLFIYIVLVVTKIGGTFAAWKGSVALALLMLPVVTRASEVVLNLVPDSLREGPGRAALARDRPRRPADGAPRPRHGLAPGRGARCGRDRAAAVHGGLRPGNAVRPEPADELAAAADLQRRRPGPGPIGHTRVGRSPYARRPRPDPDHPGPPGST